MAADQHPRRPAPFSLRLSTDERARLEAQADGMALGTYMRMRLLGRDARGLNLRAVAKVQDRKALARVLAQLGASRLANNVNQLARAANTGTLPVTPETEAELRRACINIQAMRADLMTALGQRSGAEPS